MNKKNISNKKGIKLLSGKKSGIVLKGIKNIVIKYVNIFTGYQ